MCDYCTKQMYKIADTPEKRLAYRLQKFMDECKRNPMNSFRCDSIARVIDNILTCEMGDAEHELEVRKDIQEYVRDGMLTDADVEEAIMHEQLDRDAR